jgi:4-hydroxybenzoate polyprenyltransferase/phosphoserine phosphatase
LVAPTIAPPTDTLLESLLDVLKRLPHFALRLPFWLLKGKAEFKRLVAAHSTLSPALLPYREPLLEYLREEKARGRRIVLATAAHRSIAEGVAAHLGLFDTVLATDAGQNLKGPAKLAAIRASVGRDFAYAGDSPSDLPIWKAAAAAVLVGVPPGLAATVRREVPVEREFVAKGPGLAVWLQALRVHQWLKNTLLFVPLLTAFTFHQVDKLAVLAQAFLAFSFAASATYLVNDLWDLASDRAHPRKRFRPFASARLPILRGLVVAGALLVLALALGVAVSKDFAAMVAAYVALTAAYSLGLKGRVMIDVIVLSLLYTLRILAGSVAIEVTTSAWLLAFSVFLFLSLALVKRCSELVSLESNHEHATRGRDYRVSDLAVLWPLGVASALSSVVVFGMFIDAPETRARYVTPTLLWLVAVGLIYWLARLWIKTSRGEMHDDPMVFALKDRGSRVTVLAMIAVVLAARFTTLPPLS